MKHRLLYTLGPIVLIMVAFATSPAQVQKLQPVQPVQQAQPVQSAVPYKAPLQIFKAAVVEEARKAILQVTPTMYASGWIGLAGVSNASYNLMTGEIWVTSINDGKTTYSNALAGFRSSAIQNTGTSTWKNATVTVTMQVISGPGALVAGNSFPNLSLASGYILNGISTPGGYFNYIVTPSPGRQYILTSVVGDLLPGSTLQGWTYVTVFADRNNGVSAYVKVVSIKINL